MSELVTLTIDGKTVQAPKGSTIWQAARDAGIFIPIYCYHPKMPPLGACRICLVEVEKMPKPMAGCTTQISEGMVVKTDSKLASDARAGVMEFLLINHPLDCPICDKGGECDLQNYAVEFGQGTGRFREEKRHLGKAIELGPTIVLDRERCIMCQRCARFSQLIVQDEGLIIEERGAQSQISTFPGRPYDSQFSGNTIEMCPVGALTSRIYRFKARPWELRHTGSVCAHCSVGCNIQVDSRLGREVVRFVSRTNDEVDDGWLCDRGRFGHGFIQNPERLKSPLLRNANGKLEPASWQQTLEYITAKIKEIQNRHGSQSFAAVAGTHCTNEEISLFHKFARNVLGTDKVVSRMGNFGKIALNRLPDLLTATIAGVEKAKAVLLVGADVSGRQPIMELRLKKAYRQGTKIYFLGGVPGPLARFSSGIVEVEPDKIAATVKNLVSGVKGNSGKGTLAAALKEAGEIAIWFEETATLVPGNETLFENLVDLAGALGVSGRPGLGLGALSEDNNSAGARLVAAQYPQGYSYGQFLSGDGGVKAAIVIGANPAGDLLATGGKPTSLTGLELLVVSELFLSETAQLAHVVLPTSSFAEIDGTFTNLEGRVQLVKQAIPPLQGTAPNLAIILELASRLGKALPVQSVSGIFEELANENAAFAGLSYEEIGPLGALTGANRKVPAGT